MQIIKQGRVYTPETLKLNCTGAGNGGEGCSAVLEVTFADIYETTSGGGRDYYKTFCCPCCGAETDIPDTTPNYSRIKTLGKRPTEVERSQIKAKYMAGE